MHPISECLFACGVGVILSSTERSTAPTEIAQGRLGFIRPRTQVLTAQNYRLCRSALSVCDFT
jgi:hypothetical protein